MNSVRTMTPTWDIFCKVIDNFGDAGVCWRLAKILNHEHGVHVRLWIDGLPTLCALVPVADAALPVQVVDGVTICNWAVNAPVAEEAATVIEGFGCGLPEDYIAGMAARERPPVWLVLEYLSAESWVDHHHGLASPHPRLPLQRYFFFPGFTPATGGLLREASLLPRHEAFDASVRRRFWHSLNFAEPAPQALTVSMFAYADAPFAELLRAMAEDSAPVMVAVPAGVLMSVVHTSLGPPDSDGVSWKRGALEVRALPFLSQARYDELLRACNFNFVRGEDSLVRALWAARPLVWQPYRQNDGTHQRKMAAFLDHYCAGLDPVAAGTLQAFWQCWSSTAGMSGDVWPALRKIHGVLAAHAGRWTQEKAGLREMASQLVEFARNKVK